MIKGYTPNYKEILEKLGTAAYVFDVDVLRDRLNMIKATLGEKIDICYAMKANPFIVKDVVDNVDRYEVCSHGEFKICEKAEIAMEKVVLSGVYKEDADTERIIHTYGDKILYTSESVTQFHLINNIATEKSIVVNMILRITTGNQFGMNEDELCQIIENRGQYKGVNIVGIQHFSGTQRKNLKIYKEELEYCDNLIEKLEEEYGFVTHELEFGTGFFFDYFQPNPKNAEDDYKEKGEERSRQLDVELLKDFKGLLNDMRFKGKIALEIGRFIAAPCGRYYTKIVDKKYNGDVNFAIVDGGIHQLNYFGQMMGMKLPWYRQLKPTGEVFIDGETIVNVSGALCTINDNIVKQMPLTNPQIKDILEFRNAGAYSMTETPALFLSRDLPKVFIYDEQNGLRLVRDRFEAFQLNF